VIVDLKSTQCARPWKFLADAAKLRYHQQTAFYTGMLAILKQPCEGFVFIAVEKSPPYPVLCCEFDALSINKGRDEVERLLDLFKKCTDENKWPGYSDELEMLTLPYWALTEKPFESAIVYELENP
jgi:exodeoxyribonuclease VIII